MQCCTKTSNEKGDHQSEQRWQLAKKFALVWTFVLTLVIGAAYTFHLLEKSHEKRSTRKHINDYNSLMDSVADDVVKADVDFVFEWMEEHGDCLRPTFNHPNWDFSSSVYLTFQLITTIGYGTFTPTSQYGKLFAVLIVLIIMPLYNYGLSMLNNYIVLGIQFIRGKIWPERARHTDVGFCVMSFGLLLFWLAVGAGLFLHRNRKNHMTFFEGIYFTFITITTVGLGDFTYSTNMTEPIGMVWTLLGISMFATFLKSFANICNSFVSKMLPWANKKSISREIDTADAENGEENEKEGSDDINSLEESDDQTVDPRALCSSLIFFLIFVAVNGVVISFFEHPKEKNLAQNWHNVLASHEQNLSDDQRGSIETMVNSMTSIGICSTPKKGRWNWQIQGSIFYFFTVFTTIGYGFYAPQTNEGRALTLLVAVPGFVMSNNLLCEISKIPKMLLLAHQQRDKNNTETNSLCLGPGCFRRMRHLKSLFAILLTVVGSLLYRFAPEARDGNHENGDWGFWGAMWFWFITFTTIGFGDLGPEDWHSRYAVIFSIFFSLVGIAAYETFFSMVEGIFVHKVVVTCVCGEMVESDSTDHDSTSKSVAYTKGGTSENAEGQASADSGEDAWNNGDYYHNSEYNESWDDWDEHLHDESGEVYYVNRITGESVWAAEWHHYQHANSEDAAALEMTSTSSTNKSTHNPIANERTDEPAESYGVVVTAEDS